MVLIQMFNRNFKTVTCAAMSPFVSTAEGTKQMLTKMEIRTQNVSIVTFLKW